MTAERGRRVRSTNATAKEPSMLQRSPASGNTIWPPYTARKYPA